MNNETLYLSKSLQTFNIIFNFILFAKKHVNNNPDTKWYGGEKNKKRNSGEEHSRKSKKLNRGSHGSKYKR